ncbi:DUF72 domain-containing protein [Flavobacterium johnsoniae]|uniref:DUF72 domain-containing protein n=1 Tax=Flavobacterium johnsoniae TaxID=986 RepID=UPI0025AF164A|nr:DUF72 domain-containing protein [Flavobacterium johnsoniae]WJS93117.1 DUF72 domain-containing protein [Flavobacterium johnsoniae]
MKNQIAIGCSSFYNSFWKNIFYPRNLPSKSWFDFYCQHFNTYEFNGSFYKFPTVRVFNNWYDKTPESFLFSVKVPKEITHIKKLKDCEALLDDFYEVCKYGMKEKLGAILFQFPPSYDFSKQKLESLIGLLNYDFNNVIEFRHKTWWNEEVWNTFKDNNITFCSVSYPDLPSTIFKDFPLIYVRFHGVPKLFHSGYSSEELHKLNEELNSKNGFVYFNNTASEAGILNALELKRMHT